MGLEMGLERAARLEGNVTHMLDNFRLRVFRAVAERLNFTRAAEALFLTQPAVTRHVQGLEADLGVTLFDRTGGRIRLTSAGEMLLDYARRLAALAADAEQAVSALRGDVAGLLALGASTTIAQYVLPRLLGEFMAQHHAVQLSVLSANTDAIAGALAERRLALGLIEGPADRADLKVEPFMDDELLTIVPRTHEWAGAVDVPVSALAAAPLIMRERGSGTRRVVERALAQVGHPTAALRVVMELDSTEAIKSAVLAGLGVGFVSAWALPRERRLGTLAIVRVAGVTMHRQFQFIYPHGSEPDGPAGAFLRFARSRRPEPGEE